MRLIIRMEAEADLADAYDWYEDQREGLGEEFLDEISITLSTVIEQPLRFPAIYRKTRRALVHRFPYGVFFQVRFDTIAVVAALHLACDPRRLHRRARR
jgi:toxin ParE1/3/4